MAKKINKLTDLGIPAQPFQALTEDMRKNEAQSKSLAVAQEVLSQSLKENAKDAERLRKALGGKTVTDAQSVREYNALQKEAQRIIKENEQLKSIQIRNAKLEEDLLQKKLRTEKMMNAEKQKTLTLHQQETKKLNDLRNAYRELEWQNKGNTKEGRALYREFQAQEKAVNRLNEKLGVHTHKVGQYERALGGLRNMLGQVGLAFGAGYIFQSIAGTEIKLQSLRLAIKNVTSSNAEYEQSLRFIKELSLSYGQDLVVLTDTYKNFIASSKSSGLDLKERQRIYESIIKSGSALALSNEQIEGSLLAVSQMFSKGNIQAEELRGQLSERLPGSFGLMAKAMGVSEMELGKMLKAGEVLAKDALPLLATELEKTFGAKAQENLKTVGGAWKFVTTKVSEYASSANEGGRITRFLASALIGLGNNLGLIVTTLKTAVILWTTYKARLIAVNVAQALFANNTGKLVFSVKQLRENLTQGESATKRFGGALKSIGWTAIIAGVATLTYEIYKLVTGIELAELRTEQYALALEKVQKKMSENSEKRTEKLRNETNAINLSNKSEAEKLRLIKALNEQAKQELESDVKRLTVKHKLANAQRLEMIAKRDAYKAEVYGSGFTATIKEAMTMGLLEKAVTNTTIAEKSFREMLTQTKQELISYDQAVVDMTVNENASTEATKESTKANKDNAKSLEDLAKAREYLVNQTPLEEKEREDKFADLDMTDTLNGEQQRNVLIAEYNRINKEIEISQAKQKGLSEEQIKLLNEELIIARENEILAQMELDIRQTESDIEKELIRTRATQEISNLTIENQLETENANLEKKAELYHNLGQAVELSSDAMIKSIDRRIEAVDREIEAQKKLQDLIQEGAEQGSENANKSLAEAQEAQRQAEIEKAQLEQRKQRVLMITAFLTSYTKNMEEGMPSGEAFARALADRATVEALINSMPAYFDGIEDTGTVSNPLDKNGGRVALLHDNERVVSAKENKELIKMGVSNSDLPYYVRQGMLMENTSFQNIEQSLELNGLTKKLDEVVNVIKNKPETTWNADTVVDGVLSLTRTTKRGNQIINDRFNYRA